MYIILLRVKFFSYSLIYYLLHFPPIFLHLSPNKGINPAELNPLNRSIHHKEVSISIRTVILASHLQCPVPFHSNSGPMQRKRAKCSEKPKKRSQKLLSCDLKWKRAQRSGKRPQDLKAEWDQIYWRKFSKIKFLKWPSFIRRWERESTRVLTRAC